MTTAEKVPTNLKYLLTIPEAVQYFGIGDKRLRNLLNENPTADYILMNGKKFLIKRKKFEELLDSISTL